MAKYIQNREVNWLKTPKKTIWITTTQTTIDEFLGVCDSDLSPHASIEFITPEDKALRTTAFGVRLDKHKGLFIEVE